MYLSDIANQARNNLKSRKTTTVINIGLLFFSLLVIMASEMFSAFYNSVLGQVFNGVEGRTLFLTSYDTNISEDSEENDDDSEMTIDELYSDVNDYLKNDDRVEATEIIYNAAGSIQAGLLDEEFEGLKDIEVNLNTYIGAYESCLLNGKSGDLKQGEIYIPKYLNVDNLYLTDKDSKIEYKDGDKYIGKTVKINFSSTGYMTGESLGEYQREFTIVGTYDNFSQGNFTFMILANAEDMKEILSENYVFDTDLEKFTESIQKKYGLDDEECYKEYNEELKNYTAIISGKVGVIVKDYEDIDDIESKIIELTGQLPDRVYENPQNKDFIDGIINAVRIAGYILIAVSTINITFSMIKSILKRRKEFAILSAVGYKNKNIYSIMLCEMIMIAGISIAAIFIMYGIALIILHIYIAGSLDEMYGRLSAVIPAKIWLTRIGLVFVGMLIAQLSGMAKVKSIVPAKELKEE